MARNSPPSKHSNILGATQTNTFENKADGRHTKENETFGLAEHQRRADHESYAMGFALEHPLPKFGTII
jgi:hypothetical protein